MKTPSSARRIQPNRKLRCARRNTLFRQSDGNSLLSSSGREQFNVEAGKKPEKKKIHGQEIWTLLQPRGWTARVDTRNRLETDYIIMAPGFSNAKTAEEGITKYTGYVALSNAYENDNDDGVGILERAERALQQQQQQTTCSSSSSSSRREEDNNRQQRIDQSATTATGNTSAGCSDDDDASSSATNSSATNGAARFSMADDEEEASVSASLRSFSSISASTSNAVAAGAAAVSSPPPEENNGTKNADNAEERRNGVVPVITPGRIDDHRRPSDDDLVAVLEQVKAYEMLRDKIRKARESGDAGAADFYEDAVARVKAVMKKRTAQATSAATVPDEAMV